MVKIQMKPRVYSIVVFHRTLPPQRVAIQLQTLMAVGMATPKVMKLKMAPLSSLWPDRKRW